MCLKKLKAFFLNKFRRKVKPKISILIPFSSKDKIRKRNFKWLLKYWKYELPDAEVIIGHSKSKIFRKGEALNDAARKARGDIFIILDADGYLDGSVIENCANKILEEIKYGNRLWYIPYFSLFRLTKETTELIIKSNPSNPVRINDPLPSQIENGGNVSRYGRRYGAMIMIFPREAYDILGCFDERFEGWGGEDISLLRALDTLYSKHKNTKNNILHLWHPFIGENYKTRKWHGQKNSGLNGKLAMKYSKANRNPSEMRKLVDEGCKYKNKK